MRYKGIPLTYDGVHYDVDGPTVVLGGVKEKTQEKAVSSYLYMALANLHAASYEKQVYFEYRPGLLQLVVPDKEKAEKIATWACRVHAFLKPHALPLLEFCIVAMCLLNGAYADEPEDERFDLVKRVVPIMLGQQPPVMPDPPVMMPQDLEGEPE